VNTKTEKSSLREDWKTRFPHEEAERERQSLALLQLVKQEPLFGTAKRVGIFFPRIQEPHLTALWEKRPEACCFPRCSDHGKMIFSRVSSLSELTPGYAGILEPGLSAQREPWSAGDLVLVPGLSFDEEGRRLGSGKGFYDRFLADLPKGVAYWGICFDEQLSPVPLPEDKHDMRMQRLVLPSGIRKLVT
jgi:5-formyltetrahydrofolate cyclo-ligase